LRFLQQLAHVAGLESVVLGHVVDERDDLRAFEVKASREGGRFGRRCGEWQ
jgi:hypothetical protein